MNAATLTLSLFTGNMKKQVSLALVTMAIVLSLPFLAVVSMGSGVLQFLAGTPNAEAAASLGFYMGGPVDGDTYAWGNCTYWAYAMRLWAGNPIPTTWGNANTWDDSAELDGYVVDTIPAVGAVYQTDGGNLGHVAYVIAVDPATGAWTISEMNVNGLNIVGTRTFPKDSAGYYKFIHDKKGAPLWTPLPILTQLPPTGGLSLQP